MNEKAVNNEILLKGSLQFKDFLTYNIFHLRRRFITVPLYFFVASILISLLVGIFKLIGIIFITLFLSAASVALLYFNIYRNSKKAFSTDSLMQYEQHLSISEKGIHFWTERTDTRLSWTDIVEAYEYKDIFILYISNIKAIIVPNRYFGSSEVLDGFKILVNQKMNHRSNLSLTISDEFRHYRNR